MNTMCLRDEYADWYDKKIEKSELKFLANEDYEKSLTGDDLIRFKIKEQFDGIKGLSREDTEAEIFDGAYDLRLKNTRDIIVENLHLVGQGLVNSNLGDDDSYYVKDFDNWTDENWNEKLAELKVSLEAQLADVNAKIEQEDNRL